MTRAEGKGQQTCRGPMGAEDAAAGAAGAQGGRVRGVRGGSSAASSVPGGRGFLSPARGALQSTRWLTRAGAPSSFSESPGFHGLDSSGSGPFLPHDLKPNQGTVQGTSGRPRPARGALTEQTTDILSSLNFR